MFKWFQRSKTNPPEESSSPPPLEGQLEGQVPPTELAEGLENEAELLPEAEAKKDNFLFRRYKATIGNKQP